jgi:hypothetical protein
MEKEKPVSETSEFYSLTMRFMVREDFKHVVALKTSDFS